MRLGLAVEVPRTIEQQTALMNVMVHLTTVSQEVKTLTKAFAPTDCAIMVEGRPLEKFLDALASQLEETLSRVEL